MNSEELMAAADELITELQGLKKALQTIASSPEQKPDVKIKEPNGINFDWTVKQLMAQSARIDSLEFKHRFTVAVYSILLIITVLTSALK